MIATFVHVWVNPDKVTEFIHATLLNHYESVKEAGNLRFDILQDFEDPSKFVLYEAYETEEAAAAHKATPHYLRWRDAVSGFMMQPREGVKHRIVAPPEVSKW